ncbi:MAG: (2Fe-2S)-binding protein [Burkholderiales bacterium]|nr:(2Fe-2S)-binding protein [Burkholderiales bacterium]
MTHARFVRLGETGRAAITLSIDGREVRALEGDTLMVAMLGNVSHLRHSEFGGEARSGFCLMGACQDCWVYDERGERLRSCSTIARDGMRLSTTPQEATWPNLA